MATPERKTSRHSVTAGADGTGPSALLAPPEPPASGHEVDDGKSVPTRPRVGTANHHGP